MHLRVSWSRYDCRSDPRAGAGAAAAARVFTIRVVGFTAIIETKPTPRCALGEIICDGRKMARR